jgi:lysophospholipase L1-like esterase
LFSIARAEEPKSEKVRIVLVGDSTVTDKAGWGLGFAALVKPGAECINQARGGASSKSYYDSGLWKRALEQKPTYVLIQFGHNDQPGKGAERETDPKTTYREYLGKYIDEARQAGAQPILVTSLVRRIFNPDGKLRPDLEPYAEGMKAVAAEKQVPLVDLHARSKELAERLGPEKAKTFGPAHPTQAGQIDGTHLNPEGAAAFAPLIAEELVKAVPALRDYVATSKP